MACGELAGLEPRQLGLDVGAGAEGVELTRDVVAGVELGGVVEGAGGDQLVDGLAARLHLGGLVLGTLDGEADVAHLLADARHRLADARLRLGGGVGRLDRLLAGAEGLDLGLQPLLRQDELLLLALERRLLLLEGGDLRGEPGLAGQRLAGEVLATGADGLLGLSLELGRLLLELVDLELDALAAGGHVGDTAADLGEELELPLVAVVEGLAGVLRLVQGLVGLGAEDQADALHETHRGGDPLLVMRGWWLGRLDCRSHPRTKPKAEVGHPATPRPAGRGDRLVTPSRSVHPFLS